MPEEMKFEIIRQKRETVYILIERTGVTLYIM